MATKAPAQNPQLSLHPCLRRRFLWILPAVFITYSRLSGTILARRFGTGPLLLLSLALIVSARLILLLPPAVKHSPVEAA